MIRARYARGRYAPVLAQKRIRSLASPPWTRHQGVCVCCLLLGRRLSARRAAAGRASTAHATERHPRLPQAAPWLHPGHASAERNALPRQRAAWLPPRRGVAAAARLARLGPATGVGERLARPRPGTRLRRGHAAGLLRGRAVRAELEWRRQHRLARPARADLHAALDARHMLPVVRPLRRRLLVDDVPRLGGAGGVGAGRGDGRLVHRAQRRLCHRPLQWRRLSLRARARRAHGGPHRRVPADQRAAARRLQPAAGAPAFRAAGAVGHASGWGSAGWPLS